MAREKLQKIWIDGTATVGGYAKVMAATPKEAKEKIKDGDADQAMDTIKWEIQDTTDRYLDGEEV
jgi:hypothetical protein